MVVPPAVVTPPSGVTEHVYLQFGGRWARVVRADGVAVGRRGRSPEVHIGHETGPASGEHPRQGDRPPRWPLGPAATDAYDEVRATVMSG